MSIGVLHGQTGGAGLAVKVVGGSQRPETGKQGLIWVNTDQKITSWTMQVEEPTEPTEGMVWVFITTGTKLNALKKNGIWFTPTSARQYSDGGWVKKTGEYYNNDQWFALFEATINITYPAGSACTATDGVTTLTAPNTSGAWDCVVPNAGDWVVNVTDGTKTKMKTVTIVVAGQEEIINIEYVIYLYKEGDLCLLESGGWQATAKALVNSTAMAPSITLNDDHLYGILGPSNSSQMRGGIIETVKDVDLRGYSTVKIDCAADTYSGGGIVSLMIVDRSSYQIISSLKIIGANEEVDRNTFDLTIPEGTGLVDIAVALGHNGSNSIAGFAKIWMYELSII